MSLYEKIARPLFFKMDPESAHEHVIKWMRWWSKTPLVADWTKRYCNIADRVLQTDIGGLLLDNPIGLAAGFDKYVIAPFSYPMFGFGFAELGSFTFKPQIGNPKPRLWRIPRDKGIIVYYGLCNGGAESAAEKMRPLTGRNIPYGASIAPSNDVAIENMTDDYLASLRLLYPVADYITLNVSCPNVASCDVFTQLTFIKELLQKVGKYRQINGLTKPIFVKIGPDWAEADVEAVVDACMQNNITGIVATNLVKNRSGLNFNSQRVELNHPGGISGKLVAEKSNDVIRRIYRRSGGQLKIIGVGGVFTAEDAYRKIKLGASATQLITGFIYGGPFVVRKINHDLKWLLRQDGLDALSAVVGVAA